VLVLRTLSSIICGRQHPLYKALQRADMARDDALGALGSALLEAWIELERLPALRRRQIVSSYAGIMLMDTSAAPRKGRPPGGKAKAEARGAA
jgi:hypothetical protein